MPMRICLFEAYITHSIHRKSKFTIRTIRSTFTANQNLLYAQHAQRSPQIKLMMITLHTTFNDNDAPLIHASKRQKPTAQGNTLGKHPQTGLRPVRAKALYVNMLRMLLSLQDVPTPSNITRGVTPGCVLMPPRGATWVRDAYKYSILSLIHIWRCRRRG